MKAGCFARLNDFALIAYVTLKLHSHNADFSMEWVNLNERMTNDKAHLGFTFAKILGVREFGCGY
jgi:hypothetical protein